jgi:hypothetical protein
MARVDGELSAHLVGRGADAEVGMDPGWVALATDKALGVRAQRLGHGRSFPHSIAWAP